MSEQITQYRLVRVSPGSNRDHSPWRGGSKLGNLHDVKKMHDNRPDGWETSIERRTVTYGDPEPVYV